MKKSIKRAKSAVRPKAEPQVASQNPPDIAVLINRMLQQLISLERKIDALAPVAGNRPAPIQPPSERKPDNSFRERILHKAVCADCSKECEVPFKPSSGRPVYCKECFAKRKNGAAQPKENPDNRPGERVLVYERRFQRDNAIEVPKAVEKKRPNARRRR